MPFFRVSALCRWCTYWLLWPFMMILLPGIHRICSQAPGIVGPYPNWMGRVSLRIFGIRVTSNLNSLALPQDGCVFLANHRSWIDQVVLYAVIPRPIRFVAKAGYFKIPILAASLKITGHYSVDRQKDESYRQLFRRIREDLQAGHAIVMYPEGTRSTSDRFLRFERGPFLIAGRTAVPVIATHIFGTLKILNKNSSLLSLRPGNVQVYFEPPEVLAPCQADREAVAAYQKRFVDVHESIGKTLSDK